MSTPKVYGNLHLEEISHHPDVDLCVQGLQAADRQQVLASLGNLLEHSTFRLQPNVEKLKTQMIGFGCQHVLMSGSGPTVFAAFCRKVSGAEITIIESEENIRAQYWRGQWISLC